MENLNNHPFALIGPILLRHHHELTLEFSRYIYKPQSLLDSRKIFNLPASELTKDWLISTINQLGANEELALHSRVRLANGESRHIPMIDFSGSLQNILPTLSQILSPENSAGKISIYNSGRSFHGYGDCLLNEADWLSFMGTLLLANLPGKPHIVDCRWIGHRLRAGYAALRWSCNTQQYYQHPIYVTSL